MISPDGYYEEYLKGKTAEQIMTAIRGLKQEIGHLKNTMEHPEYGSEPIIHPSEDVRLWCTRMYLERAKKLSWKLVASISHPGLRCRWQILKTVYRPSVRWFLPSVAFSAAMKPTPSLWMTNTYIGMWSIPSFPSRPISLLSQTTLWEKTSFWRGSEGSMLANGGETMTLVDLDTKFLMAHSGNWRFSFPTVISQ